MAPPESEKIAVNPYTDLPETVPTNEHKIFVDRTEKFLIEEATPNGGAHVVDSPSPRRPWWRRRRFLILGVVLLCGIIAGVVAGVVTSKKHKSDGQHSPSSPSETATAAAPFGSPTTFPDSLPESACRDTVCPQMFSMASFSDDSTLIFGRGNDRAIWYRQLDQSGWANDWQSLGGEFISQPTSVSMREGRVDVSGVCQDQEVRTKSYQNGVWDSEWTGLSGTCSSQPVSTSYGTDKLSMLCVNADHKLDLKYYKGRWGPTLTGDWQELGGYMAGTPALDSGGDDRVDIVAYGLSEDNDSITSECPMMYKRYEDGDWQDWEGSWGEFKGDPAILAISVNQTEYFGVDRKGELWHNTYKKGQTSAVKARDEESRPSNLPSDYTTPKNLGGNFESSPVALAIDESRIDVLAVGNDDRLKHKARVDGEWASEWEDLGGYFNSAPLAWVNGSDIAVFGIGPNGTAIHGLFSVGNDMAWSEGNWFSDEGTFSSSWFSLGSA